MLFYIEVHFKKSTLTRIINYFFFRSGLKSIRSSFRMVKYHDIVHLIRDGIYRLLKVWNICGRGSGLLLRNLLHGVKSPETRNEKNNFFNKVNLLFNIIFFKSSAFKQMSGNTRIISKWLQNMHPVVIRYTHLIQITFLNPLLQVRIKDRIRCSYLEILHSCHGCVSRYVVFDKHKFDFDSCGVIILIAMLKLSSNAAEHSLMNVYPF